MVADDVVAGAVEPLRQHPLRERHADRVRDALSERTGRDLDPRHVSVLGMAGRPRAQLTELLEVVLEADVVAGQIEGRIQQHRGVAAGQHEPVAVRPLRIAGVVAHHARIQDVGERRQRHRGPRMPRVGLLHPVHRQRADRVDAQLIESGGRLRGGHESGPDRTFAEGDTTRSIDGFLPRPRARL